MILIFFYEYNPLNTKINSEGYKEKSLLWAPPGPPAILRQIRDLAALMSGGDDFNNHMKGAFKNMLSYLLK